MALLAILHRRLGKNMDVSGKYSHESSPWFTTGAWRANSTYKEQVTVLVGEEEFHAKVKHTLVGETSEAWEVVVGDNTFIVSGSINNHQLRANINGIESRYTFAVKDDEFGLFNQDTHINFSVVAPSIQTSMPP
jgi:3-methylcrotonyl-CoA carboxylase alpha subunit